MLRSYASLCVCPSVTICQTRKNSNQTVIHISESISPPNLKDDQNMLESLHGKHAKWLHFEKKKICSQDIYKIIIVCESAEWCVISQ